MSLSANVWATSPQKAANLSIRPLWLVYRLPTIFHHFLFHLTRNVTNRVSKTGAEMIVWPWNTVTVLSTGIPIVIHLKLHLNGVGEVELWRLRNPVRDTIATELSVEHILVHVKHWIQAIFLCNVHTLNYLKWSMLWILWLWWLTIGTTEGKDS